MSTKEIRELSQELKRKSIEIKIDTIKMLDKAGSGHVGGAFSLADIMTSLYFHHAKVDGANPEWEDRDYILLSNGHVCPVWYSTLAHKGFFDMTELDSLRKIDSLLQGHPKAHIPGVENSSGPLGHGLSQAIGIALGLKMDGKKNRVFCMLSDGEQQEGQTWEAAMSAPKWKLDNLVAIIDQNGIQIEGTTDEIMPLGNLKEKYEAFGWLVTEIDGHNYEEILSALTFADQVDGPVMVIAHTKGGNGVSYMEGKYQYHDWKGKEGEAEQALEELEVQLVELDN